tara:strand:- start:360 stop:1316 length:957 start_codon:yes stop_codon:yes gene_type:complete
MIFELIILFLGLFFLVKSSDLFVKSSSKIAEQLGVSKLVIGLTLVAIGTSLPELVTGIFSSLSKDSALIMGNVVGSNIANIALVFGLSCFFVVYLKKDKELLRELRFLFLTYFLFLIFSFDLVINRFEGLALILLFLFYLINLFKRKKEPEEFLEKQVEVRDGKKETFFDHMKYYLFFILSLVVLIFSAKYVVSSAISIASDLGISSKLIGLTIIAIGTSLPELSVTIQSIRKRYRGLLVGNLIGSSIINILLIIGITSSINDIKLGSLSLFLDIPIMFLTAFLMYIFFVNKNKFHRALGYSLLGIYILFLILEFIFI